MNSSSDTSKKGNTSEQPRRSSPDTTVQSMPPLDITVEKQTVSIPELPAPLFSARTATTNGATMYASVAYGGEQAPSEHANMGHALVRPTVDGWYLLGVAWYWWLVCGALLAAGAWWLRRALSGHRPTLVKQ